MIESDLAKIKFMCCSHLSTVHEHICTYRSVDIIPGIIVSIHTKVCKDGSSEREHRRYAYMGKIYDSKESFLKAATAFEEERKSKFEKK